MFPASYQRYVDLVPESDGGPNGNGYHHENNSNDYYFANWQGSLFDDRERDGRGCAFSQIAICKTQNQVCFIIRRHTTHLARPFILALRDVRGERAENLRDLRAKQPAKSINRMRADSAERAAATFCIRPPIPLAIP